MKRKITTQVALIILLLGTNLLSQNSTPVAVNDTLIPIFSFPQGGDTTLTINILENDYDPDEEPIKILEVNNRQKFTQVSFTDSTLIITTSKSTVFEQAYDYRICKVNDATSISNWAYLSLNPCYNPDYPVARTDTVYGIPGYPVTVNVLKNDYHPLGDSIFIYSYFQSGDSNLTIYCPEYNNENFIIQHYRITDSTYWLPRFDWGRVYIKLLNNEWYDSLDINNINARFNCNGRHFWNLSEFIPHFKAPNGSEISSLFTHTLWMGGFDDNEQLHIAAERYYGEDFWSGPVSNVYDSLYDMRWFHVWNLKKEEIEFHKANWWKAEYDPLPDILSWPGNGDIELGQAENIAP